ncbi:membrane protein insertion efficiency factor YidD [Candidatus Nomurabacteria bacterium]|nr:membrane protein insertion efficiency factor YidD [Candidatus Nomurabacteria bacterium]
MRSRTYLIKLIDFYQKYLSGGQVFLKNSGCVFYPTCSEYTKQAIYKYGSIKGSYLGLLRILRCHPWQKNHMDPVP